MLKVYNTLTKKKEEFIPLSTDEVKMYVCGPTVYNLIHIGNARPIVVFDAFRRYLIDQGYKVCGLFSPADSSFTPESCRWLYNSKKLKQTSYQTVTNAVQSILIKLFINNQFLQH